MGNHILVVNGVKVRQPVFLVGAPHSGASLLARALKRSPGFHVTVGRRDVLKVALAFARQPSLTEKERGARQVMRDAFARAWQINPHTCLECTAECRTAGGVASVGSCVTGRSVTRYGDATTELLYSADVLVEAFPDAKLVQVIRDGRDVVSGMLADRGSHAWLKPGVANVDSQFPNPFFGINTESDRAAWKKLSDTGKCALRWRGAVLISARLRREIPDEGLMTVRYEDLVADPGAVADGMSHYLGARVSPSTITEQRRGAAGAWRKHLSALQVAEVEKVAGEELTRLGYLTTRR